MSADLFNQSPRLMLRIYGSDGVELFPGDTVMVTDSRNRTQFYTTVCIVDGRIYPTYGFSYSRIEKVQAIPPDAIPCKSDTKYPAPIHAVHLDDLDERERFHQWIRESIDMGEQRGPRFYFIEQA